MTHTLLGDRRGQNIVDPHTALLLVVWVALLAVLEIAHTAAIQLVHGHDPGASLVVLGVGIALAVVVTIVQFVHSEVVR